MKRRIFIRNSFASVAGLGTETATYAWQVEPFCIEFVEMEMPIKNLPTDLIRKTLIQISDMHIGKRFSYSYITETFDKVKELKPAYVVHTGNFVTLHKGKILFEDLEKVMQRSVKGTLG